MFLPDNIDVQRKNILHMRKKIAIENSVSKIAFVSCCDHYAVKARYNQNLSFSVFDLFFSCHNPLD